MCIRDRVTGDEADIELDGDNITIKGDDGSELTLGSEEWPKGKAIDLIPEFKNGTISSTMNSDTACVINLKDVEQEDFESYMEEVKSLGYTKDSVDMDIDMVKSYYALSEKDNSQISLTYSIAVSYTHLVQQLINIFIPKMIDPVRHNFVKGLYGNREVPCGGNKAEIIFGGCKPF